MIRVRDLAKTFPGNAAASLRSVSLDVGKGLFFTLFGPSGCGKSTLLRCLAGLETPDSGEIAIDGTTVFSAGTGTFVPANRRRIGMVFQSYAVWPHMTVLQNVAFPLEARGLPDVRRRAREALATVGLEALEGRYASRLSGGQQQRVAFARAIVADPAVLLLDEPLSNLDAALRDQMRGELQALQRRLGVTTVYVTHDQGEALALSDHIAVMRDGAFVETGTPEDLYRSPRSAFTARLLGGANVLAGRATPEAGGCRIETAFGVLRSNDPGDGPVEIFIRPERPTPHGDGVGDGIVCRILARRFAGEATELDLAPEAGGEAMLRCRTTAHVPAGATTIRVAVDPADVRVLGA